MTPKGPATWDRHRVVQEIRERRIIAVVRAGEEERARRLVETIMEAGLRIVEVTLTTPGALAIIEGLSGRDDVCVGAGTVMDEAAAASVIGAGGRFVIAPNTHPPTVAFCRERGIPVIPGALTPSEVARAWALRPDLVKVFPVGPVGGAAYVRAIRGPLPDIPIVATGGTHADNIEAILEAGAVAVGVSDGLATAADLREGRWSEIGDRAWALKASAESVGPAA